MGRPRRVDPLARIPGELVPSIVAEPLLREVWDERRRLSRNPEWPDVRSIVGDLQGITAMRGPWRPILVRCAAIILAALEKYDRDEARKLGAWR